MVKLACPSLLAHSSLGSDKRNGAGPSPDAVRTVLALGRLWNEVIDGLDDKGGEGIVAGRGMTAVIPHLKSVGVSSEMSATDGDCNGDCTPERASSVGLSPMNGGSSGVVGLLVESSSTYSRLALATSIGGSPDSLRRSSKMVRAGEGGMEESMRVIGCPVGLTSAEEVAELVRERQ